MIIFLKKDLQYFMENYIFYEDFIKFQIFYINFNINLLIILLVIYVYYQNKKLINLKLKFLYLEIDIIQFLKYRKFF